MRQGKEGRQGRGNHEATSLATGHPLGDCAEPALELPQETSQIPQLT